MEAVQCKAARNGVVQLARKGKGKKKVKKKEQTQQTGTSGSGSPQSGNHPPPQSLPTSPSIPATGTNLTLSGLTLGEIQELKRQNEIRENLQGTNVPKREIEKYIEEQKRKEKKKQEKMKEKDREKARLDLFSLLDQSTANNSSSQAQQQIFPDLDSRFIAPPTTTSSTTTHVTHTTHSGSSQLIDFSDAEEVVPLEVHKLFEMMKTDLLERVETDLFVSSSSSSELDLRGVGEISNQDIIKALNRIGGYTLTSGGAHQGRVNIPSDRGGGSVPLGTHNAQSTMRNILRQLKLTQEEVNKYFGSPKGKEKEPPDKDDSDIFS